MIDEWRTEELGIWDVTSDEPVNHLGYITRIQYGTRGSICIRGRMPWGKSLYALPIENAVIEVARVKCGRPDIYENYTAFVRATDATIDIWSSDLETPGPVFINVMIRGNVQFVKGEQ